MYFEKLRLATHVRWAAESADQAAEIGDSSAHDFSGARPGQTIGTGRAPYPLEIDLRVFGPVVATDHLVNHSRLYNVYPETFVESCWLVAGSGHAAARIQKASCGKAAQVKSRDSTTDNQAPILGNS